MNSLFTLSMKAHLLIGASIILTVLSSSGQEISTDVHRIQLGMNVSTDYCYRTLVNAGDNSTYVDIIDYRDRLEEARFGYSTGINFTYNLNSRWGVEAGTQYSYKSIQYEISGLTFGDPVDPRYGFVYDPNAVAVPEKFIDNYYYLEFPVRAIYSMGKKRMRFLASLGIMPGVLLKSTHIMEGKNQAGDKSSSSYDQTDDFEKFALSPIISIGAEYAISKKLILRAEPTFRYGLLTIIDAPVSAHLWNAGLNFSICYAIK